jgi:hypothetical protein
MKTLTKVLTTATLSLTLVGMANAATLVASDKSLTTELCMVAAQGNRAAMFNAIKASSLSKSYVAKNVKCNDMNISSFVDLYGKSPEAMNNMIQSGQKQGDVSITDIASL